MCYFYVFIILDDNYDYTHCVLLVMKIYLATRRNPVSVNKKETIDKMIDV